jgi:uncharacterized protein YbaR (Trm112 family)
MAMVLIDQNLIIIHKSSFMKNYLLVLQLFTRKDKKYRPELTAPFYHKGMAMATDQHVLVYMPACLLPTKPDDYTGKIDFNKVIPSGLSPIERVATLTHMVQVLDQVEKEEEIICTNDDECEECEGRGTVEWEYTSNKGRGYELTENCPVCKGRGIQGVHRKTGKMVVGQHQKIKIGISHFSAPIIEKIIKVMDLLEETECKLIYQVKPEVPSIFQIGAVNILVMPTMVSDRFDSNYKEIVFNETPTA